MFVYIITNRNNTVLYTGVTRDVFARARQHRDKVNKCFTSRYNVNKLVYFEELPYPMDAIRREKQIKAGSRAKKVKLIERMNPRWLDLSREDNYDACGRLRAQE